MPRMTPEREAAYALDFGVSRDDLKPEVQAEYDRLLAERRAGLSGQPAPEPDVPARTPPEVRAKILQMLKRANRKYAKAFEADRDRLALASFIGTDSWAEYGQVILQMAILDTLLSIESQLASLQAPGPEDEVNRHARSLRPED